MTRQDLEIITTQLGDIMPTYVKKKLNEALGPLYERLQNLEVKHVFAEQKIKSLEERPRGLLFEGLWDPAVKYERDSGVQWGGSVWVAKTATIGQTPGASDSWVLAVRRGKPGKSARDARDLVEAS